MDSSEQAQTRPLVGWPGLVWEPPVKAHRALQLPKQWQFRASGRARWLHCPFGISGECSFRIKRKGGSSQLVSYFNSLVSPLLGFPKRFLMSHRILLAGVDIGVHQRISSATYFKFINWALISLQGVSVEIGEITLQQHKGAPSGRREDWKTPIPSGVRGCHLTMKLSLAPSGRSQELPLPL